MTIEIRTKAGAVKIDYYYDDRDQNNKGWYAHFLLVDADGEVIGEDDTQKIWSVTMPTRRDAERRANRLARGYARRMLASWRRVASASS